MPESEVERRGGTTRYRRVCVDRAPGGECLKYVNVAVVGRPGPRGGRTVAGPVHRVRGGK